MSIFISSFFTFLFSPYNTLMRANPSYPLLPTVCIATAVTRVSFATVSVNLKRRGRGEQKDEVSNNRHPLFPLPLSLRSSFNTFVHLARLDQCSLHPIRFHSSPRCRLLLGSRFVKASWNIRSTPEI